MATALNINDIILGLREIAVASDAQGFYSDAEILATAATLLDSQQAKIDALMLEYCPDETTKEQLEEWAKHQVPYGSVDAELELEKKSRGITQHVKTNGDVSSDGRAGDS